MFSRQVAGETPTLPEAYAQFIYIRNLNNNTGNAILIRMKHHRSID